jgi:hypothetical protein
MSKDLAMNFLVSNNIYQELDKELQITLHQIDGLTIPFSRKWSRIGINLSGGADSACLLMILCNIITKNNYDCEIHAITHIRHWNTRPWQGSIANNVYNKFVKDYPTIKFYRHNNFISPEIERKVLGPITKDKDGKFRSGDEISVRSFNRYITVREKFDALFKGTNANPSDMSLRAGSIKEREKPAEQGILEDLILHVDNIYICHPFRFVQKNWIVAQYHRQNKLDLYNLTRSCEGELKHYKIKKLISNVNNYDPSVHTIDNIPLCGDCWWCKERKWAEERVEHTLKELKLQ